MAEPARAAAAAPLLAVRDLEAWYGESHVLHGITFDVHDGEVVTLLGRNGAGKTTTLKAIMGIIGQRRGSVQLKGRELIGLPSRAIARAGIAICPEERGIFASLSVEENLMLPPRVLPGGLRSSKSSSSSPTSRSGCRARAPSSPAASSRCWRSAASCGPAPICSCSTSRPKASRRSSCSRSAHHRPAEAGGFTIVLVEQNFHFAASVADRHYVVETGRVMDTIRNADLDAKSTSSTPISGSEPDLEMSTWRNVK